MTVTPDVLPAEESLTDAADAAYHSLVRRLSEQSVVKHFDAYADIAWDDPEYAVVAHDPRFQLPASDPIAAAASLNARPLVRLKEIVPAGSCPR